MIYDFVPLHDVWQEIKPRVASDYASMNTPDSHGPPDIDWDAYLQMSEQGYCFVVTMRKAERLVGYMVVSVSTSLRYKTRLEADSNGFFIDPDYRAHSLEMLGKAMEYLKNMGVLDLNFLLNDPLFEKWLGMHGAKSSYRMWSISLWEAA